MQPSRAVVLVLIDIDIDIDIDFDINSTADLLLLTKHHYTISWKLWRVTKKRAKFKTTKAVQF